MNKREQIIWLTGVFEGEGTFRILKEKQAKGLQIPSTDLDLLDTIKKFFGGKVYKVSKRKEHWKQSWVWCINSKSAYELVLKMQPYLMSRRLERSRLWVELYLKSEKDRIKNQQQLLKRNAKIREMSNQGMTHSEIANKYGLHRTTVLKIIKRAS